MGLQEGLAPIAAGILLYLVALILWKCFLSPQWKDQTRAEARARMRLGEALSEDERLQLARSGYVVIPSPTVVGRVYRIPARTGWIDVYELGRLIMKLCPEPREWLPAGDLVLMHKLMIQRNEREYLRTANVRWVRQGC